ncbi:FAD-dependent oxidoreductase [Streptomyces griseus]|uniref:FAD-dependent oxidoreductase n=1 Tax=Streptomyces griseus TaxID=1911 RepID=UPI0009A0E04A|nr:FAD-dependent oxidoreductase [Streptomyces griseus]
MLSGLPPPRRRRAATRRPPAPTVRSRDRKASRNTTENTDAVVVGAGAIGSSVALELARSGLRVVVVDKFGGAGNGSTGASSAVVRFTYPTIAGVDAAWESRY